MDKPGLQRALPYMLVAFIASLMFVYAIRSLQNMDPVWMNDVSSDGAQVGLALAAFASMGAFLWGMGAFDPKMSEHGDHAEEHEEVAPEKDFALKTDGPVYRAGKGLYDLSWTIINDAPKPMRFPYINLGNFLLNWLVNIPWFFVWLVIFILWRFALGGLATIVGIPGVTLMVLSWIGQIIGFYIGEVFLVTTVSVILVIVWFAFALLPHGLRLQTTTEPNADVAANGVGEFVIPVQELAGLLDPQTDLTNQPIPETSQFAVFIGFIIIIFISLAVAAGLIAIFFYYMHQGVKETQEIPTTDADLTPPLPVREIGGIAGGVINVIRAIPEAIGYKK